MSVKKWKRWFLSRRGLTVQGDGNAFREDVAIGSNEDGDLAQGIHPEQPLVAFLVLLIMDDDVQFDTLRFGNGEDGSGPRIRLQKAVNSRDLSRSLESWMFSATYLVRVDGTGRHCGL